MRLSRLSLKIRSLLGGKGICVADKTDKPYRTVEGASFFCARSRRFFLPNFGDVDPSSQPTTSYSSAA